MRKVDDKNIRKNDLESSCLSFMLPLFFSALYIYTGSESIASLMCYLRISSNLFNEHFFIFLKLYHQKKEKENIREKEKENESNFFVLVRFLPFCVHHYIQIYRHIILQVIKQFEGLPSHTHLGMD